MAGMRRCPRCGGYTLRPTCATCSIDTVSPIPPRYSPDDRYGEYRRRAIREEYGENGKFRKV